MEDEERKIMGCQVPGLVLDRWRRPPFGADIWDAVTRRSREPAGGRWVTCLPAWLRETTTGKHWVDGIGIGRRGGGWKRLDIYLK